MENCSFALSICSGLHRTIRIRRCKWNLEHLHLARPPRPARSKDLKVALGAAAIGPSGLAGGTEFCLRYGPLPRVISIEAFGLFDWCVHLKVVGIRYLWFRGPLIESLKSKTHKRSILFRSVVIVLYPLYLLSQLADKTGLAPAVKEERGSVSHRSDGCLCAQAVV